MKKRGIVQKLESYAELEKMFLEMWSDENSEQMEDLGMYTEHISDEDSLLAVMCMYILKVTHNEFRELAKNIPETVYLSHEYLELFQRIDEAPWENVPTSSLLRVAVINKVIDSYNQSV